MKLAIGTVVARNYLAFARVLADSLSQFHPDVPFYVVIADGPVESAQRFNVLYLSDLGIPRVEFFRFRNTRQEVVVAAKAYLLSHLLTLGFDSVVFLDADILILQPLSDLFDQLQDRSMVLTPHFTAPVRTYDAVDRDLNVLVSGVYNGGIVGVTNTPDARAFLDWWMKRLYTYCRHDVANGMHYDQRWLDYAPAFVADLAVFTDHTFNVAYWNVAERCPTVTADGTVLVEGQPCRLFHFSGFEPERPDIVTRYRPQIKMSDAGDVAVLFEHYARLLESHGHRTAFRNEWRWDRFGNGTRVPPIARAIHSELPLAHADELGDPISVEHGSFYEWLLSTVGSDAGHEVRRFWHVIYQRRPDLHQAFPDHLGDDRTRFVDWIAQCGIHEYSAPDEFASS